MAVYRKTPTCKKCNKPTAIAIYKDIGKSFVGDTFSHYKPIPCDCLPDHIVKLQNDINSKIAEETMENLFIDNTTKLVKISQEQEQKFDDILFPEISKTPYSYQCGHSGQLFNFNSFEKGEVYRWVYNEKFTAYSVSATKKDTTPYYWQGWTGSPVLAYFHTREDAIKWNKQKFN